jgi:hyperosmotically inducible periplasmic protein
MHAKMRYMSLIICLVFTVVVSACAGDRTSRSTGQAVDDSAIATKVKSALVADPAVKGTQVEVEVFKGVVQLSGFVDSSANAQKAVSIARSVNGVKEVRNSMIVK